MSVMPELDSNAQWLFLLDHLMVTPSSTSSNYTLQRELYDRARGVEILFRLGTSLEMPSSAMFTAATWFHRFYMRRSLEDYHRQDVAASCIFLATKTEECGRKLRDVAWVFQAKVTGLSIKEIPPDSPEVKQVFNTIRSTEEVLLEALCFDLTVVTPHAALVRLFIAHEDNPRTQEHAWSIAHDSYRTPLCILFPSHVIAAACYILAQHVVDGPLSPSLNARVASVSPSASLPTPPTHKSASPDATRYPIEFFSFGSPELRQVSDALCILLQFYNAQDISSHPYLSSLVDIPPPNIYPQIPQLYSSFADMQTRGTDPTPSANPAHQRTPNSTHGGSSPAKTNGWLPMTAETSTDKNGDPTS